MKGLAIIAMLCGYCVILFDLLLVIVPIIGMYILSEIKFVRKIFNIK